MAGASFGLASHDSVRGAQVLGQVCPDLTFVNSTLLECRDLLAGSFSGGTTSVTVAGDTSTLVSSVSVFGTPTHTVASGNLASTQAVTAVTLVASNVGDASDDIESITIGSAALGLRFPCTGITMTIHATDATKQQVQCSI